MAGDGRLDVVREMTVSLSPRAPLEAAARETCPGPGAPGLVSVIIPMYNCKHYIGPAIESVLNQTYPHIEVIVVDDRSTDGSFLVAQRYGTRITLIEMPVNRGAAAARNAGLAIAAGEFIAFLDGDDLWLPDKLTAQLDLLRAHPDCDWCAGAYYLGDRLARPRAYAPVPRSMSLDVMLRQNDVAPGSVLVRRRAVQRSGGFDESIKRCEDWDLWIRLLAAGAAYVSIDRPLFIYRRHRGNKSRSSILSGQVLRKYVDNPLVPPHLQPILEAARQRERTMRLLWLCVEGHVDELKNELRTAPGAETSPDLTFQGFVEGIPYAGSVCLDFGLEGRWIARFAYLDLPRLYDTLQLIMPSLTLKQCRMLRAMALVHCAMAAATLGNRTMQLRYMAQALRADVITVCGPGNRSFLLHALLGNRIHGLLVALRRSRPAGPVPPRLGLVR